MLQGSTSLQKPAYEKLKFYQDICEIRKSISIITNRILSKYPRLASQIRDAARSAKQNIREGYRKGGAGEFARGIVISQGSFEELSGDCEDCRDDGLISDKEFEKLSKLFQSASYMSTKFLASLYKMDGAGKWKVPLASLKKRYYKKVT